MSMCVSPSLEFFLNISFALRSYDQFPGEIMNSCMNVPADVAVCQHLLTNVIRA